MKKKRGITPTVDYFSLVSVRSTHPDHFDYCSMDTKSVAVFIQSLSESKASTLYKMESSSYRAYWLRDLYGNQSLILFFHSKGQARVFIQSAKVDRYDWFKIPVLLNNGAKSH